MLARQAHERAKLLEGFVVQRLLRRRLGGRLLPLSARPLLLGAPGVLYLALAILHFAFGGLLHLPLQTAKLVGIACRLQLLQIERHRQYHNSFAALRSGGAPSLHSTRKSARMARFGRPAPLVVGN